MSRKCFLVFVLSILSFLAAVIATLSVGTRMDSSAFLQVGNLSCGVCVENILEKVRVLDRNAEVQVDLETGLVRVTYDDSKTDASAIAGQLSKAGYPATVFKTSPNAAFSVSFDDDRCQEAKSVRRRGAGENSCG